MKTSLMLKTTFLVFATLGGPAIGYSHGQTTSGAAQAENASVPLPHERTFAHGETSGGASAAGAPAVRVRDETTASGETARWSLIQMPDSGLPDAALHHDDGLRI